MHVWNYLESNISLSFTLHDTLRSVQLNHFSLFSFLFSPLHFDFNHFTVWTVEIVQLWKQFTSVSCFFFFFFTRHYTFRQVQIIPSFSFIHHVFNHLTVWKSQSITNRQIYSFFFWFFFSMLLYSFPFTILPFLLPFTHITVKLDSCPRHWSFVKTVSLSNVFITFTHERGHLCSRNFTSLASLSREQ